MAKKLKLQQERAVIPGRKPWTSGKDRLWARTRGTSSGLHQRGRTRYDSETGHERGRQQLPLAAIHLVANWLLPSPAEFGNQLI
jgi:hypothetical protein